VDEIFRYVREIAAGGVTILLAAQKGFSGRKIGTLSAL
jgi:hypothetical protein